MAQIEKWLGFRIHCYCCGDSPGSKSRKQAFSAAKKRAKRAAIKEGLEDFYQEPQCPDDCPCHGINLEDLDDSLIDD